MFDKLFELFAGSSTTVEEVRGMDEAVIAQQVREMIADEGDGGTGMSAEEIASVLKGGGGSL